MMTGALEGNPDPRSERGPSRSVELSADFLRRVRNATWLVGALGVLALTTYAGLKPGLAAAAGLVISLLNLKLLEELFVRGLSSAEHRGWKLGLSLLLKFPLLLGGAVVSLGLFRLPPIWFLAGFTLIFAVVVLKILGMLLMSRNRRADGWRMRRHAPGSRRDGPRGRAPSAHILIVLAMFLAAPARASEHARAVTGAPAAAQESAAPGDHPALAQTAEAVGRESRAEEPAKGTETVEAREHASEHAGSSEEGERAPELPNAIEILHDLFPGRSWSAFLYNWQNPIYSTLVIVFLCVIAIAAYRKREMIPGKLQNVVELGVESFSNFILGVLGPRGKEFVPFLGTLFFYIWFNNLQGLIPFFKSPTSVINTTVSLGICVFGYVQYTGMTKLGLKGYLHHMLGSPRDAIGWGMVPLMLPLHLIEEVAKPVSLSLRLFGNIMGEDVLLGIFTALGVGLLAFMKLPLGIPLHLPFIFLAMLMSTIQALVFTLLATIYFSQMLPHEEEEGEAHGH
jgi:F-type H+-transporting ATPase subunit a